MKIFLITVFVLLLTQLSAQKIGNQKTVFDPTSEELMPDIVLNTHSGIINNPAFTGYEKRQNIICGYNDLNPHAIKSYTNGNITAFRNMQSYLGYDASVFKKRRFAIGTKAVFEQGGVFSNKEIDISLSFRYKIDEHYFRFGILAYAFQKQIDFSRALWFDQIDVNQGFVNPTSESLPPSNEVIFPYGFNYGVGIIYTWKNLNTGISYKNLLNTIYTSNYGYGFTMPSVIDYFLSYKLDYKGLISLYPTLDCHFVDFQSSCIDFGVSLIFLEQIALGYDYNMTFTNTNFSGFRIGMLLYEQLILNTVLNVNQNPLIREKYYFNNYQFGLTYQFGRSKKDLAKWNNM